MKMAVAWFFAALLVLQAEPKPHLKAASTACELGSTRMAVQKWAEAERLFLKAIDIEPTYSNCYRLLVDLYIATARPLEASLTLTRLLQIEPKSVRERLRLGRLLLDQQQWSRALAQFSIVMKIDPRNADGAYGFAYAANRNGMRQHALQVIAAARRDFPKDDRFIKLAETLEKSEVSGEDADTPNLQR